MKEEITTLEVDETTVRDAIAGTSKTMDDWCKEMEQTHEIVIVRSSVFPDIPLYKTGKGWNLTVRIIA